MSGWDKVKDALRVVAPAVATVIGGPLAGGAVSALSNLLLGKPDASPEELEQAILSATPEQIVEMKRLDLDYKKAELKAYVRELELGNQEMQSARDAAKGPKEYLIAYIVVWATLSFTGLIVFGKYIPDDLENQYLMYLAGVVSGILPFFFGRVRR